MAREIKKTPLKQKIARIVLSPFIFPLLTFAFVAVTMPIVFLLSQQQQNARQDAATIATRSIAINTDDISYEKASAEIVTKNSVTFSGLIGVLIVIGLLTIIVFVYRKRLTS